jgi:hypothetical protein
MFTPMQDPTIVNQQCDLCFDHNQEMLYPKLVGGRNSIIIFKWYQGLMDMVMICES